MDKLILESEERLQKFRDGWKERGNQFKEAGMDKEAKSAYMLAFHTDVILGDLKYALAWDKHLDASYDRLAQMKKERLRT